MCPTCPCFCRERLGCLLSAAPWCARAGLGRAGSPGQHFTAMGFAWVGICCGCRSKQGWGARGDGDAVPCHERSAPCFVFKGHTAAVTASAVLRSQPDPKALPAALASAFFVPASPLLQDFCLSPLASRASQHLGTSEVAVPPDGCWHSEGVLEQV